jgi:hypothetical protein
MVEPATAIRSVNVKSMAGEVRTVTLPVTSFVRDLKAHIAEVFSVPAERQRLIFQGKLLKDEVPLDTFLKEDGLTVHMMMRAVDAEPAQAAPPQEQRPQSGFFGMPFESMMGDPQGFLRQVTQIVTQIVPENMQGIQLNFGADGPLFQVLQRPGNAAPSAPPPQSSAQPSAPSQPSAPPQPSVPSQPSAQVPVQPPAQVNPREEWKEGDLVLPYGHLHNLAQIINSLTGTRSNPHSPQIPALPFPRNSLSQLGHFLNFYQFQLLRLLPFLSRLADLLQRESLITNSYDRSELQSLARSIGTAMKELQTATQRVSGLFQELDVNNPPRREPAAADMPVREPVAANMSLRELLIATEVGLQDTGIVINGLLDCFTLNDLGMLFEGKLEPLERVQPTLERHLLAKKQPNGSIDLEERRAIIDEFVTTIRSYLVLPPSLPPTFDYLSVTTDLARKFGDRLVTLVLDYHEADFAQVLRAETLNCIGTWANQVVSSLGSEALDPLITLQLDALFGRSVRQSLRSLHSVAVPMAQALVQAAYHSCDRLEATWSQTIEEDQRIQAQAAPQRGLSRSYSALDPFGRARYSYESPQALLNEILTYAMQDAGVSLPPAALPEELAIAFVELLQTDMGKRIEEDKDFDASRFRHMQQVRRPS